MATDRSPSGGVDDDVDEVQIPDVGVEEGGDAACWAHLVCAECGRVTEPGVPHRCEGDDDGPVAQTT